MLLHHQLLALLALLLSCIHVDAAFISYPRPSIYSKSAHFSLKVNGTYAYTVSYDGYDYVQLSMDEGYATEFRIALTSGDSITSYSISPERLPISAKTEGNELVFSLTKAHYLIVKINDEKEFVVLLDPSELDVPASSGANVYNVRDYNADDTGKSVTKGIQAAMDAAAGNPGSIVYVPAGLYTIGNLLLRNHTSLYLAGGAVLRFSGDPKDYTTLYNKPDLYNGTWWIQTEINSTNIKVYGRGTIDGNGYNTRKAKFMADLLVPVGTTNFTCDGVLVRDSSFWAVTPIQVTDALITNIKILDRQDVTQDDGIDVVESTRVTVRRAIAIANDDSFSAKTWPYKVHTTVPYPYAPRELRDVLFDDCLAWTLCYSYKIGEGVWEVQDNVTFRNSVAYKAGVGIGIHHKFGSEVASNITFEDIDIERLSGSPGGMASWMAIYVDNAGEGVGPLKDLTIRNIRARQQGSRNAFLQGFNQSSMVSGVTIGDVYMFQNKTPATTFEEMKLFNVSYSEGVKIVNS
ncbi:pectin lyase-like protein [Talaromyces proteolyticus]|uniref:Pectin lyase-like protein n=1 Tax=Talaromyces proteolyticus TaxID=1131652 RepID=A0AAD4L1F3_9EURO|nr:pectin lyase-like protein [Talaromyces proteolyticus]KAH8703770.1 pectin lyase-like protein [Talaromyces proteolyticus]